MRPSVYFEYPHRPPPRLTHFSPIIIIQATFPLILLKSAYWSAISSGNTGSLMFSTFNPAFRIAVK